MAVSHANFLEQRKCVHEKIKRVELPQDWFGKTTWQKKVFTQERVELPQDWFGTTMMAAFSMFWNTNMAAMTSCHIFSTPTNDSIESAAYNSTQAP